MEKANLDWENLPFAYMKTDSHLEYRFENGKWSSAKIVEKDTIELNMSASCLHYGQEAFEGLKAFRGKDGKIRIFRMDENWKRMNSSARGIMMAEVPWKLFQEAVLKVVKMNEKYVPPYGEGASLYIRPLLLGTGPQVGVKPAEEYMFMVFVGPVGPYFKEGFNPVRMEIVRDFHRAAPRGTGHIKVGGNYAASLVPAHRAHQDGYASVLFLDSSEEKFIDEAGPANFFAIKGNSYITPKSVSILPSITNKSLQEIAKDEGMTVEVRPIPVEELAEFEEVGACGTAAVISPICSIIDRDSNHGYHYCKTGAAGPVSEKLYRRLRSIQEGEESDKFGWITFVE